MVVPSQTITITARFAISSVSIVNKISVLHFCAMLFLVQLADKTQCMAYEYLATEEPDIFFCKGESLASKGG